MAQPSSRIEQIRQRHHRGKRWNCAQDIGDLLGLLDEAVNLLDRAVVSQDACEALCGALGECATCINSRARKFVERLRGEQ